MSMGEQRTLLLGTWALLLPLHSAVPQQHTDSGLTQMVDSVAQTWLQAGPVAGMSVALVRASHMLLARGYGFADLENRVPATEHTVYRIGSMTKQFTAAAILQLAEQRRLRLEDDIRRYLPGYDTHGQTITIRELLNHTSGIPSFTELPPFKLESASISPRNRSLRSSNPSRSTSHPEPVFTTTTPPSTCLGSSSRRSRASPIASTCESTCLSR